MDRIEKPGTLELPYRGKRENYAAIRRERETGKEAQQELGLVFAPLRTAQEETNSSIQGGLKRVLT